MSGLGTIPTLTTDRLTLRPWTVDDAAHYFDVLRHRSVTAWLGDPEPLPDVDAARDQIASIAASTTRRVPGSRAIVPGEVGHPVGSIMLWTLPGDTEVEIGWWMHPDHTGHGWVTEAARAVLDEALTHRHPRVWAGMWPHNGASAAVCQRLGMPELGEVEDPWYGTIEYRTSRMFCVEHPEVSDGRTPQGILADRLGRVTFEHASAHPP